MQYTNQVRIVKGVQMVASRRYVSLEGDKNSHLPQGSHLDKQNPTMRS